MQIYEIKLTNVKLINVKKNYVSAICLPGRHVCASRLPTKTAFFFEMMGGMTIA